MEMNYRVAKKGHVYILTEKGVQSLSESVRCGAQAGESIRGHEVAVPVRYITRKYVLEVEAHSEELEPDRSAAERISHGEKWREDENRG